MSNELQFFGHDEAGELGPFNPATFYDVGLKSSGAWQCGGVNFAANWPSASWISRRKMNIFRGREDHPFGAHDNSAPQPEARNWPSEG